MLCVLRDQKKKERTCFSLGKF